MTSRLKHWKYYEALLNTYDVIMKNNGKVRDVRSLACKIKVLNGRVPGTWKWTIWQHIFHVRESDPRLLTHCSADWVSKMSLFIYREKGRDLTQSYDKSLYPSRNIKRTKRQHKQRHKKFAYTAVADRLRTVSWSNYGHPTGVVNMVYGPNLPTPGNSRVIKRTHV